jgi:hypothetical protein
VRLSVVSYQLLKTLIGLNSKTKAALEASHKEQLLRKGIIAYLGAASDYTGKIFAPKFPVMFLKIVV